MAPQHSTVARLKDVAGVAGVSSATASLILNGKTDSFPGGTIERVRSTASELGYRPNAIARSLTRQRTHTIGLISDTIATTPFAGATIRGAQEAAWAAGHVLMLIDTEGDAAVERAGIDAMHDRRVDGLLYARMHHEIVEVPEQLGHVPTVLLDARATTADFASVVPDEIGAARSAVSHLISAGHRRIGLVQTFDPVVAADERLAGYRHELEANGISFDPTLVVRNELDGVASPALVEFLSGPDRPSAVFCFNDLMAFVVYNTAQRLGLSIPGDLSVVGFDNQETVAKWLDPGLTTLQLPHYEMGRWAVEHLERLIQGEDVSPEQHRMPCPLVERQSVGPPKNEFNEVNQSNNE